MNWWQPFWESLESWTSQPYLRKERFGSLLPLHHFFSFSPYCFVACICSSFSLSLFFVFAVNYSFRTWLFTGMRFSNYLESENCKAFEGFLLGIFGGFQSVLCSNSAYVWFGNKGTNCSWSAELQRNYNGKGGEWVGKSHWWMKKAQKTTRAGVMAAAQQRNETTTKNVKSIQKKPNQTTATNKQTIHAVTCSNKHMCTDTYNKNQSPSRSKSALEWWSCRQDLLAQLQYASHWVFVP